VTQDQAREAVEKIDAWIEAFNDRLTLDESFAAIEEHGPEGVVVVIQGRLMSGDKLADAGLVAQANAPARNRRGLPRKQRRCA
jgi:hypothetical protein